jgi:uncharacterized delta-60 repeat protein
MAPDGTIRAVGTYTPAGSADRIDLWMISSGGQAAGQFVQSGDGQALALTPNGQLLVGGYVSSPSGNDVFAVWRFNSDLSLDPSFGAGGVSTIGFSGGTDEAYALALQPDGKIAVAGVASTAAGGNDFGVARLNADGSLDSGFGTDGKQTIDFGGNDWAYGLALQPDGKIVLAGDTSSAGASGYDFALATLNPDGSLDQAFGAGGKATVDFGAPSHAFGVALQPDGRIVAAGQAGQSIVATHSLPWRGCSGIPPPVAVVRVGAVVALAVVAPVKVRGDRRALACLRSGSR